jgi:hypothetical protein
LQVEGSVPESGCFCTTLHLKEHLWSSKHKVKRVNSSKTK